MSHSEKEVSPFLPHVYQQQQSICAVNRKSCWQSKSKTGIYVITSLVLAWYLLASHSNLQWSHIDLRWSTSSRNFSTGNIYWTPCPDNSETFCSYHSVPMDWSSPQADETVSLALRMLPAIAPQSEHLGFLFINPGGPGGSGSDFVLRAGSKLSTILSGRYNIISWDPRGVNLTTPSLGCFSSSGDSTRFARDIEKLGLPLEAGGGKESLTWAKKIDTFSAAMDGSCRTNGHATMLRSSSTAFVVRDMKSILEALGEKKLSYWGFSYGTILGATFAAMFPELVHRVLLDGVSDASLYTNDMLAWGTSGMQDTHKTWQGFVDSCAKSGSLGCDFARENSTSKDVQERFETLLEKVRKNSVPVFSSTQGPGIVTASDVQYLLFHTLYKPKAWPAFAKALKELEAGDGTAIYEAQNPNTAMARHDPTENPFHRSMENSIAATAAIMCSDTDPKPFENLSSSSFLDYAHNLGSLSPTGEIWAIWVNQCRSWKSRAIEAYRGPWTKSDGLRKTNFPILFFSNTADPVTPLSAARTMSDGFGEDSASLVIQNAFGHCSLAHPGLAWAKIARAYFLDGVVPKTGTIVDADEGFLFPHPGKDLEILEVLSEEDRGLTLALQSLSTVINGFL